MIVQRTPKTPNTDILFLLFMKVIISLSLSRCPLCLVLRTVGPWWQSAVWTWACLCRSCRGEWRWPGSRVTPDLRVTSLQNSKKISHHVLCARWIGRWGKKSFQKKYFQICLRDVENRHDVVEKKRRSERETGLETESETQNQILTSQSGFRVAHTSETALMAIIKNLHAAIFGQTVISTLWTFSSF